MNPLAYHDAILSAGPLGGGDGVELGPMAAGPDTLPRLPKVWAEAYFLDETGLWKSFKPNNYEARTVFSEHMMGFATFRQQHGMVLLSGPSGGAGHRFNEGGFDGVGFPLRGRFACCSPTRKHQGQDRRQRHRADDQLASERRAVAAAVPIADL